MNCCQERRPYLASDCDNLHEAEKWRRQIIGETSRKVAQIQNGKFTAIIFSVCDSDAKDTIK